jgi:hypothetical protein
MATTLPSKAEITDSGLTQGQVKTGLNKLIDSLGGIFGTTLGQITPKGNIESTDIQSALYELDGRIGMARGMKNFLINGNFDYWQRGASQTTAGYLSADRWGMGFTSGNATLQSYNKTSTDWDSNNYNRRVAVINGTSLVGGYLYQKIEGVNTLQGKTVTLSFYFNTISGANAGLVPYIQQNFGTGGSPSSTVNINNSSGSWSVWPTSNGAQHASFTFSIPTISGKTIGSNGNDALMVIIPFSGTFSVSLWGVQLEEGNVATPFEYRLPSIELMLCYRYFYKTPTSQGLPIAIGQAFSTSTVGYIFNLPTVMRTTPIFTASYLYGAIANGNSSVHTGLSLTGFGGDTAYLSTSTGAGYTAGNACILVAGTAGVNGYASFDAEL